MAEPMRFVRDKSCTRGTCTVGSCSTDCSGTTTSRLHSHNPTCMVRCTPLSGLAGLAAVWVEATLATMAARAGVEVGALAAHQWATREDFGGLEVAAAVKAAVWKETMGWSGAGTLVSGRMSKPGTCNGRSCRLGDSDTSSCNPHNRSQEDKGWCRQRVAAADGALVRLPLQVQQWRQQSAGHGAAHGRRAARPQGLRTSWLP